MIDANDRSPWITSVLSMKSLPEVINVLPFPCLCGGAYTFLGQTWGQAPNCAATSIKVR